MCNEGYLYFVISYWLSLTYTHFLKYLTIEDEKEDPNWTQIHFMCKFNVLLLLFMIEWKSKTTYSKPSVECENKKISWFF